MANEKINCMVKAVISATGRPDITDKLSDIRTHQKSGEWRCRGYQELEAEHLAELLKTAGDQRGVETDAIRSLSSLIATAYLSQAVNAHVFIGLPRTTENALPHIVHIGKRVPGGFQSDQQFLPDNEITEVLAGQDELPLFFAFALSEPD